MITALLAVIATLTPGDWALYRGSTIVSRHATEAACVDAAKALNVARSYTCRTSTGVVVSIVADPPPPPVEPPPAASVGVFTDIIAGPIGTPLTVCANAPIASVMIAGQPATVLATGASLNPRNDCWRVVAAAGPVVVNGLAAGSYTATAGAIRPANVSTISAALSAVNAGDVIVLDAGMYPGNYRFLTKGGFAVTSAVGAKVTINGVGGADDVHSGQSAGIVLSSIYFTGRNASDGCPVNLQNGANQWRVVNNDLTWPNAPAGAKCAGIAGNGSGVSILGNNVHDITGGTENHGIYLDGRGPYEVAYNAVTGVTGGNLFQTYDVWSTVGITGISLHDNYMANGGRYGLNLSDQTVSLEAFRNTIDSTALAGLRFNIDASFAVDFKIHDNTFSNVNTKGSGSSSGGVNCDWNMSKGTATVSQNTFTAGRAAAEPYDQYGSCPVLKFSGNTWTGFSTAGP